MTENKEPENRNIHTGGGNYNEFIGGDYVQGNFFKRVINIFIGQQLAPVGNPARPENQRLLLAQVKHEVAARLEQSLNNAVLINLGKELQPQQVRRPWDAEIKIGLKAPESLPENTSILEVFDREEIAGRMLILGDPGCGKTTTQLELAQSLIQRAEEQPYYSIPVLFSLSSWKNERQSLTNWLIAELKSKYGVSAKLGKEWVENRKLLPLLDGLDELELNRQETCVNAINQLLKGECRPQYIVICSRSEEYSYYSSNLHLSGAIYLQSLTNDQIRDYLIEVNHADLWQTINYDSELLELVKIPLLLSITVLASQEISIDHWRQLPSTSDRIQHLLDIYIQRMLIRPIYSRVYVKQKPPADKQTRRWLIWLSQQLQRESQTEFIIEKIQPYWLKNSYQKWLYTLIFGLICGFIQGLITLFVINYMSNLGIVYKLLISFYVGISYCLIFGIITENEPEVKTIEILKISWKNLDIQIRNGLIKGLFFVSMLGGFYLLFFIVILTALLTIIFGNLSFGLLTEIIIIIIFYKFINDYTYQIIGIISIGIISILIHGLTSVLTTGLIGPTIETKTIPNQGIWKSLANANIFLIISMLILGLINGLISGFINGLTSGLIMRFISGFINGLTSGLIIGLIIGFILWFSSGGQPYLQHFCLRLILYRHGYIPWNYARFLNYCTFAHF